MRLKSFKACAGDVRISILCKIKWVASCPATIRLSCSFKLPLITANITRLRIAEYPFKPSSSKS